MKQYDNLLRSLNPLVADRVNFLLDRAIKLHRSGLLTKTKSRDVIIQISEITNFIETIEKRNNDDEPIPPAK